MEILKRNQSCFFLPEIKHKINLKNSVLRVQIWIRNEYLSPSTCGIAFSYLQGSRNKQNFPIVIYIPTSSVIGKQKCGKRKYLLSRASWIKLAFYLLMLLVTFNFGFHTYPSLCYYLFTTAVKSCCSDQTLEVNIKSLVILLKHEYVKFLGMLIL